MAELRCHDCGQVIDGAAEVCPHCGAGQSAADRRRAVAGRLQGRIHRATLWSAAALGCLAGWLIQVYLIPGDGNVGLSILLGGVFGFLIGSVVGQALAEKYVKVERPEDEW